MCNYWRHNQSKLGTWYRAIAFFDQKGLFSQSWKKQVIRVLQKPIFFIPNLSCFPPNFTKFYKIYTFTQFFHNFKIVVIYVFSSLPNLYPQKVWVDKVIAFSNSAFAPIPYCTVHCTVIMIMYCTLIHFTLHSQSLKPWNVLEHPNLVVGTKK